MGCAGRNNIKTSSGSSGHTGVTRPVQTRKKPKESSAREREERGRGERGGVYHTQWLCVCDNEECECGVGVGVNATMLSETLAIISLAEAAARAFRLRKEPMNLCA